MKRINSYGLLLDCEKNSPIEIQEVNHKINDYSLYSYHLPRINMVFYEAFIKYFEDININLSYFKEEEKNNKFEFLTKFFKKKIPKVQNIFEEKLPPYYEQSVLLYLLMDYEIKNMCKEENKNLLNNFIYALRQESKKRPNDNIDYENNFLKPEHKEKINDTEYSVFLANIFLNLINEYNYSNEELIEKITELFENYHFKHLIYVFENFEPHSINKTQINQGLKINFINKKIELENIEIEKKYTIKINENENKKDYEKIVFLFFLKTIKLHIYDDFY